MIFDYSSYPHARKHGPIGYLDYKSFKPWLRDEFTFRCVYCLMRESWYPNQEGGFSVDHFVPQVVASHLECNYDNLVYACIRCNSNKSDDPVLDPCLVAMNQHLIINEDGTIKALTPEAEDHVEALFLDDPLLDEFRRRWMLTRKRLAALEDQESKDLFRKWFGFPGNIPNLSKMKPRGGNRRPLGISDSYYSKKILGQLPETY